MYRIPSDRYYSNLIQRKILCTAKIEDISVGSATINDKIIVQIVSDPRREFHFILEKKTLNFENNNNRSISQRKQLQSQIHIKGEI